MSFFTGALSGFANEAMDMKKEGKKGLLRRKKKPMAAPSQAGSTDTAGGYIPDFKRGGKVRGRKGRKVLATLEPGERVLTKRQARKYRGGGKRR